MTKNEKQKILDYLKSDESSFGMSWFDTNKQDVIKLYSLRDLEELFAMFVDSDKACEPNYEGMYKTSKAEICELKSRIDYLENLRHNYCIERAHYVGAIDAIEMMIGRKLAFHDNGNMYKTSRLQD